MTPDEMKALIAEALEKAYRLGVGWPIDEARDRELSRIESGLLEALSAHPAEETEWGAGYEADPGDGNGPRWCGMEAVGYTIREAAEREVERYSDSQIRLVRRRKAGPWSPVPEGSETAYVVCNRCLDPETNRHCEFDGDVTLDESRRWRCPGCGAQRTAPVPTDGEGADA